ncbi:MAG: AI-2E family transporter [Planctomycetaceae bacterium]|nr:AI-2E family transporter [Planctomycetaceae bacterium]
MTPTQDGHNSPAINVLTTVAALVIVIAGIQAARAIIIPFLLAIFIAVIISAILSWLKKYDIHTGAAIILLLVSIGVLGTVMVSVVGASANHLMQRLPEISKAVKRTETQLGDWLDRHGLSLDRNTPEEKTDSQSLEFDVPGLQRVPKNSEETETAPEKTDLESKDAPVPDPDVPDAVILKDVKPPAEMKPDDSKESSETGSPAINLFELGKKEETPSDAKLSAEPNELESDTEQGEAAFEEESKPELNAPVYPEYLYGPQRHIIEFPTASAASGNVRSAGYLGEFSPVMIFRSFLDSVVGMFNYALIVFLMLIFLLLEWNGFGKRLEALPGNTQKNIEQIAEIMASIRRYMFIKTLVSLLTGLLITIWLMLLGVEYAALWGTVAFLFNYIPTIGSLIAGVVPTLFVLVDQDPMTAMYVAIAFLTVNFLLGNILEPRIMGEGLGISTFVIFLSLVFWGWVLGPAGMLLAVPITMTLKIALASDERTAWIAILIGSGTPSPLKQG